LGTAASEGIPALFCQCELCMEAKRRGGKNIRTRTSMIIGEKFKIDFPPDSYLHMQKYGLDLGKLDYILISHNHSDHFDVEELANYRKYTAYLSRTEPLRIFLNQSGYEHLLNSEEFKNVEEMNPIEFIILEPFRRYETEELYFTPVLVQHAVNQQCFNFFIEMKSGKNIFYGMDAKVYPESTLEFLKKCKLDVCICDATHLYEPCTTHMYYYDVVAFHKFLCENSILKQDSIFIVNHFSHNGNKETDGGNLLLLHEKLEELYDKLGMKVAFDGMEIEI
jgi:phosphoribosyl 1,2-cyclic phosphate phosphodiesterase